MVLSRMPFLSNCFMICPILSSVVEIIVWKLFRFELGLAGVSIGVGPFSLGLGIFFYEAKTPEMKSQKRESESTDVDPAEEPEQ